MNIARYSAALGDARTAVEMMRQTRFAPEWPKPSTWLHYRSEPALGQVVGPTWDTGEYLTIVSTFYNERAKMFKAGLHYGVIRLVEDKTRCPKQETHDAHAWRDAQFHWCEGIES